MYDKYDLYDMYDLYDQRGSDLRYMCCGSSHEGKVRMIVSDMIHRRSWSVRLVQDTVGVFHASLLLSS